MLSCLLGEIVAMIAIAVAFTFLLSASVCHHLFRVLNLSALIIDANSFRSSMILLWFPAAPAGSPDVDPSLSPHCLPTHMSLGSPGAFHMQSTPGTKIHRAIWFESWLHFGYGLTRASRSPRNSSEGDQHCVPSQQHRHWLWQGTLTQHPFVFQWTEQQSSAYHSP